MAREICTSNFNTKLEALAREVKEKFDVGVWFAEVLGKRWSFIAGEKSEELFFPPKKILLYSNLGVVVECEDEEIVDEIVNFLALRLKDAGISGRRNL